MLIDLDLVTTLLNKRFEILDETIRQMPQIRDFDQETYDQFMNGYVNQKKFCLMMVADVIKEHQESIYGKPNDLH